MEISLVYLPTRGSQNLKSVVLQRRPPITRFVPFRVSKNRSGDKIRPVESHSGARGKILAGPPNIFAGPL